MKCVVIRVAVKRHNLNYVSALKTQNQWILNQLIKLLLLYFAPLLFNNRFFNTR